METIKENENEDNTDYDKIYSYISSNIKYKTNSGIGSMKFSNKIFDICRANKAIKIDAIMSYLSNHDERGVIDYLINIICQNKEVFDKSFFYLSQIITMIAYKKYNSSLEKLIIDKSISTIKFCIRISLFLNSFPNKQKEIQKMKFKMEQVMRSSYNDIEQSEIVTKRLKHSDFLVTEGKNKDDDQVFYSYKCLEFFNNLKILCELLFGYPLEIDKNKHDKNQRTRKEALKEFIKLMNEELDIMRGEEYKRMKNEEYKNRKKDKKSYVHKNSKFYKGYILPFNSEKSNADQNSMVIVNILPEYSTVFSTKARVPIKLTCECIELGDAENENFFELYDNTQFYEKNSDYINQKDEPMSQSIFSSNVSDVLTQQLSIYNPKHEKIFDKWKDLEKSAKPEAEVKKENKKDDNLIKETNEMFDDFVVFDFDTEKLNPFGEEKEKVFEKIYNVSRFKKFGSYRVKCFIAKANDDLIQEMFALQLIKKFEDIFKGCEIFVKSYEVIITSETSGLIEFLNNSNSIDGILKSIPKGWDLNTFYRNFFGKDFKKAQLAFADSLAGFCLLSYFLDIKDRHNGNIMIDNKGHIMHIDFGFLLGTSPKNIGFERASFKLVKSYVDILDGKDSKMFQYFKDKMARGLIEAKKHFSILETIIRIMSHSNIACLAGQDINNVIKTFHDKFLFLKSEEEIKAYVDKLINDNYENFWTKKYDQFQYWTNGILY